MAPLLFLASAGAASTAGGIPERTLMGLLAMAGLLILIFVILRRPLVRRGAPAERLERPPAQRRAGRALEGEAEKLLVELEEFGREIEGRLETRIRHLSRLLQEADAAAERLTALISEAKEVSRNFPREKSGVQSAGARDPHREDPDKNGLHRRVLVLKQQGLSGKEIAERLGLTAGEVELILSLERRSQ